MTEPSELDHFLKAQAPVYRQVLRELAGGRKRTHWMWFIFPQLRGLGHSAMAERFALSSLDQAQKYLQHEVLGSRLVECTRCVLDLHDPNPEIIFGTPDWLKFRSSMTLFAQCPHSPTVFNEAIDRCFSRIPDEKTLRLLGVEPDAAPVLDTLERIGVGRTAEIFAWDEGRALRLFRAGASLPNVVRELNAFRSAHELGLASPAVYPVSRGEDGIVRIGERLGFVMDRIDGPSMLKMLSRRPWLLVRYARTFAALQADVHSRSALSLPSQRHRFEATIEQLREGLGDRVTMRIRQALNALSDGTVVCHGDFHPDNVILSSSGPVIIDWGPATSGSRAADLAWTDYLFRHAGYPPGTTWWQRVMIRLLRRAFHSSYRHAYARNTGFDWSEIGPWSPVIAAVRLGDGIQEEKESLLAYLREQFGS